MKIAIFHNFMDNIGGAEMVTLILARELNADIYTTVCDREAVCKMGFDQKIFELGWVGKNAPFKQQLASLRFRLLNLKNKYDFYIIAGDWAVSGIVNNKPNFWYLHSPMREIWDLYEFTKTKTVRKIFRLPFRVWVIFNRFLTKRYVRNIDKIICSSRNSQGRLRKYLKRSGTVIYPPVDTSNFSYIENGNFWLSVNRLITHKRIEIQINAFKKLPKEKLVIVGSYENSRHFLKYKNYINSIKPENVEIKSFVSKNDLIDLYARCKGFISTSFNEDFGLTAIEAMASGKPVIAPNEGGYKESVIDGVTGKLIDNINSDKLISAIKEVGKNPQRYKKACLKQAYKFDTKVFISKIKKEIKI